MNHSLTRTCIFCIVRCARIGSFISIPLPEVIYELLHFAAQIENMEKALFPTCWIYLMVALVINGIN